MRKILRIASLTLAFVSLLAGCAGGDGPSSPSGIGRLSVRLTDAPADDVTAIQVYVVGLVVKPSGGPVVRIANDIGLVDLLSLQGTTLELVNLGVAAGDYEFVQIELDQAQSSVDLVGGGSAPLQIASEKVKVLGGFTVPEGGDTVVVFDFDAAASLRQLGNGGWLLVPVILQVSPPPG